MKMGRRKSRTDVAADGYRTCPDDWKFFLKTDLYATGCFGLGWLVLIPALSLDSMILAFITSALWFAALVLAAASLLGLVLEIRMRRTHRRLSKGNRNDDIQQQPIYEQSKSKEK